MDVWKNQAVGLQLRLWVRQRDLASPSSNLPPPLTRAEAASSFQNPNFMLFLSQLAPSSSGLGRMVLIHVTPVRLRLGPPMSTEDEIRKLAEVAAKKEDVEYLRREISSLRDSIQVLTSQVERLTRTVEDLRQNIKR